MIESRVTKLEEETSEQSRMLEVHRKQLDSIVDLLGEFETSLKKSTSDLKAAFAAFQTTRKEMEEGSKRLGVELRASLASMGKRHVRIEADIRRIRVLLRQSPEE